MTLTEFLLARIAEDEAVARAASADLDPNWWEKSEHARVYAGDWDWVVQGGEIEAGPNLRRDPLAHIARHDPARVLAECAAKRAILAEHSPSPDDKGTPYAGTCRSCDYQLPCPTLSLLWPVLRALALPYASHEDFDEAWRL